MQKLLFLLLLMFTTSIHSQDILWMRRYNLSQNEVIWHVAKDSLERIIIAGNYEYISGAGSDILVLKCNPIGETLWHRCYNFGQTDWTTDLITDNSTNIIVAYSVVETEVLGLIKFSPSGETLWTKRFSEMSMVILLGITLNSHNNIFACGSHNNYGVLVKYDSCGNQIWSRRYYNLEGGVPDFSAILLDSDGNIFVTGVIFSNPDSSPLFLAKFNNIGDLQWIQTYTTGRWITHGNQIAFDNLGNVIVAGYDGDGYNSYDALIRKYSVTGNLIWHRILNFRTVDVASGFAIDRNNNIFFSGSCGLWNSRDYFLVKYSSNGDSLWSRFYNGVYDDYSGGVVVDSLNNPIISGSSSNGSNYDVLTIKYNGSSGIEEWVNRSNIRRDDSYRLKFNNIRYGQGIINLEVLKPSKYKITMYNTLGAVIKSIYSGYLQYGKHNFNLFINQNGIYFLRVENEWGENSHKIIVLK